MKKKLLTLSLIVNFFFHFLLFPFYFPFIEQSWKIYWIEAILRALDLIFYPLSSAFYFLWLFPLKWHLSFNLYWISGNWWQIYILLCLLSIDGWVWAFLWMKGFNVILGRLQNKFNFHFINWYWQFYGF